MMSMLTVVNEGLPPLVVKWPTARNTRQIRENTIPYVATNNTPFLARCSPALSTAMTVITATGLTMDAMANGITTSSSCDKSVTFRPSVDVRTREALFFVNALLLNVNIPI